MPNRTHVRYLCSKILPKIVCAGEGGTQLKKKYLGGGKQVAKVGEQLL